MNDNPTGPRLVTEACPEIVAPAARRVRQEPALAATAAYRGLVELCKIVLYRSMAEPGPERGTMHQGSAS